MLVMPHVIVIAAGAVSLYFALRWVSREFSRVEDSLRRADRRIRRASMPPVTHLTFDAASGFYTPAE
jgi:hypothetical protein